MQIGNKIFKLLDRSLLDAFKYVASLCSGKTAVVENNKKVSYKNLYLNARKIASYLVKLGIKKGDYVATELPPSSSYYSTLLAIWMVGGVSVNLSTETSSFRKSFIYKICDISVVIDQSFHDKAIKTNKPMNEALFVENKLDDPAFVLFTSGSTGEPKGVLHSHRSTISFFKRMILDCDIKEISNHACYANPDFIAFMVFDLAAILFGGTAYIVPKEIKKDVPLLSKFLDDNKIKSIAISPSVISMLQLKTKNLEFAFSVGAQMAHLYSPDYKIVNAYGASEAGGMLYFIVDKEYDNTPLNNKSKYGAVYLLDDNNKESQFGEICFAGDFFTKYLGFDEKTKETIIENPFYKKDGYKYLFKTGDCGQRTPDNNIIFSSRKDFMVNINGHRVEPNEVENTLKLFNKISDVAVRGFTNENTNKDYLCVYYVSNDKIDDEAFRNFLTDKLPHYMIPSYYLKVNSIKKNKNGKTDYKNLEPPNINDYKNVEYQGTDKIIESRIVCAFKEVLKADAIGINDDFIKLGGTSLEAINVALEIEDLGVTYSDIMSKRTPKAIADYSINRQLESIDLSKYNEKTGHPLTSMQLNMYLDLSVKEKNSAYILKGKTKISSKYSEKDIVAAIKKLINKYPELNGRIGFKNKLPWVYLDANPEIRTLSTYSDVEIERFNNEIFDINKSMARFLIVKRGKSTYVYCCFHHLIFDLYSLSVFKENLDKILNGKTVKKDDGIFRICAIEESEDNAKRKVFAKEYFNRKFLDVDKDSSLVSDGSEDSGGNYHCCLNINKSKVNDRLIEYSTSAGSFFTSMFAYTLSRFTGSENVQFCVTTSGRENYNFDGSIGMFAKTFPLLFDCTNKTVSDYLTQCAKDFYTGTDYSFYRLSELVNEYGLDGDTIFQYVPYSKAFTEHNKDELKLDISDRVFTKIGSDAAINDILMYVIERKDDYAIDLTYSNKYSKHQIENFIDCFIKVCNGAINKKSLGEINYTKQTDLKLFEKINDTNLNLKHKDIIDSFIENVKKYPDRPCIRYKDTIYSYKEVNYISNQIASDLSSMGIKKGDAVSFLVHRSHWYLICLIALMKLSAVYVPIDDKLPAKQVSYMLECSNSKAILVSNELLTNNKKFKNIINADILNLKLSDNFARKAIDRKAKFNKRKYDEYSTSGIIFTSGTTGKPKGVCLTRKGAINLAEWYRSTFNINYEDSYAYYPSIGFVVHLNMFYALNVGACVDIIPDEVRLDMSKLNNFFINHNITHTFLTSRVADEFFTSQNNNILKVVQKGGEKLEDFKYDGNTLIFEGYGASETNACSVYCPKSEKFLSNYIGRPISNSKCYILDKEGRPVPIGAVGELCIAGNCVANSYLDNSDPKSDNFSVNPFISGRSKYARMYKTGDFAYLSNDGHIVNIGRRDSVVKVRGNRVELSEVELEIKNLDFIDKCVVVTYNNEQNKNVELVSYVVLKDEFKQRYKDNQNLTNVIKLHVAKNKPSYMVPTVVITLDDIPLNLNGKVNTKVLPVPDFSKLKLQYTAPKSKKEKLICESFESVFNLEKIGLNDDFFTLGGDSFTAIKLATMLSKFNISASDILSLRTPKNIANKEFVNVDKHYTYKRLLPLSESQLNVYLDEKTLYSDSTAYNNPCLIKLGNKYTIEKISDSLNKVCKLFPIVTSKLVVKNNKQYLKVTNKVLINELSGNVNEQDLVEPFELENNLHRFFIINDNGNYSLFLDFHHLIIDGTSLNIFTKVLFAILNDDEANIPMCSDKGVLEDLAYNQQIQSNAIYKDAEKYYDSMLRDSHLQNALLPCVKDVLKGSFETSIAKQSEVDKFVKINPITHNQLFVAAFAYTLSAYTNSEKSVFCMLESGRGNVNNHSSVGMFVKTLPLAIDCRTDRVSSFLKNTSEIVNMCMKYDFYPFRKLAKKYKVSSDILFQYSHDLANISSGGSTINGREVEHENNCKFSFNVFNSGDTYDAKIEYSDDFNEDFIENFTNTFSLILRGLIHKEYIKDIELVNNRDKKQLNAINKTDFALDDANLINNFNKTLKSMPDNIFIRHQDTSYSYRKSAFLINSLTEKIRKLKINKKQRIAIAIDRSEWYALAPLACISSGYTYLPIDTDIPDKRIKFMLEDSNCDLIIVSKNTQRRFAKLFNKSLDKTIRLINIDDLEIKTDSAIKKIWPLKAYKPVSDDACVIYTSGTTGIPKGSLITYKAIYNMALSFIKNINLESRDIFSMYASYGFDTCLETIFASIIVGATIDVVPSEIRLSIDEIKSYIDVHKISVLDLPTAFAKLFLNNYKSSNLRAVICGGEALGDFKNNCDFDIYDAYGPTEYTVNVSQINVKDKVHYSSIGSLNLNTKAYILDEYLSKLPVGAVGDLYVSGFQISNKYLNRINESQDAFIANPFDSNLNGYELMYKTGDKVRLLPEGQLGFVGRDDRQVKIRGNRVELGEIETEIRTNPYVLDTTVQDFENNGNHNLVAYIVIDKNEKKKVVVENLIKQITNNKPGYMLPSHFEVIDSIPYNINGKLDKSLLPQPKADNNEVGYVAPKNSIEKKICKVFESVLNVDKVGANSNFILLGGDSLLAIDASEKLRDLNITASDILMHLTPKLISDQVGVKPETHKFTVKNVKEGCPLTGALLSVYLDIKTNSKEDAYLVPQSIKIPKKFNSDDVVKALNQVIDHHPILSTAIHDVKDEPWLKPSDSKSIKVINKLNFNELDEFISKPFNLNKNLSRYLICKHNNSLYLVCVFHHIIYDGFSYDLFEKDLIKALNNERISYDFGYLQYSYYNKNLTENQLKEANNYYQEMLRDVVNIPSINQLEERTNPNNILVDLGQFSNIDKFLKNNNIATNTFFTGIFAKCLSDLTRSDKVNFTIIDNGRSGHIGAASSIGMYVTTIPVVIGCNEKETNNYFSYVSDVLLNSVKNSFIPYATLVNKYPIDMSIGFQYLPYAEIEKTDVVKDLIKNNDDRGLSSVEENLNNGDLLFTVYKSNNKYCLKIQNTGKYSQTTVKLLVDSFKSYLNNIVLNNNLISTLDNDKLFKDFHPVSKELVTQGVVKVFVDTVHKHSNKLAFVDVDEHSKYTYSEFFKLAKQISHKLLQLNVQKGDYVSLELPNSVAYCAARYGIWFIGAVGVFLSDAIPQERRKYIHENCNVKVVIDKNFIREINPNSPSIKDSEIYYFNDNDPMYVIYTSGSSGMPKGVFHKAKSVNYMIARQMNTSVVYEHYVHAAFAPVEFILSLLVDMVPQLLGQSNYIVPEDVRSDINKLSEYIDRYNINSIFLFPDMVNYLKNKKDSLKAVFVAGSMVKNVYSDNFTIVNVYGASEVGGFLFFKLDKKYENTPIGQCNTFEKVYLFDDDYNEVDEGEVCFAGNFMEGYIKLEEQTNEVCVNNPKFNEDGFPRLFKMGDIAKRNEEGNIVFLTRKDFMVKINGQRVETAEVESRIRKFQSIKDSVVKSFTINDQTVLCAYYISSKTINNSDIRNYLTKYLPSYMIPSYFVKLNKFPKNTNGKIDYASLKAPDINKYSTEYVAPKTIMEKLIVDAFINVFKINKIGVNDDFIQLGGNSLTAMKLIAELPSVNITSAEILNYRTPLQIAKIAEENTEFDNKNIYSYDKPYPITNMQLTTYLDSIVNKKTSAYNVYFNIVVDKKYSIEKLKKVLLSCHKKFPILRSRALKDKEDIFVLSDSESNISISNSVDGENLDNFINTPFNLEQSSSRFLIEDDKKNKVIHCVFHHFICDRSSIDVFKRAFRSILNNNKVEVDDGILRLASFENSIKDSYFYQQAKNYFESMMEYCDECRPLITSTDQTGSGNYKLKFKLDKRLFNKFLKNNTTSQGAYFSSVFGYVLSRYTYSDYSQFCIVENARDLIHANNSLGFFAKTTPVVYNCANRSISEYLANSTKVFYDTIKYNFYPIQNVLEKYNVDTATVFQYIPNENSKNIKFSEDCIASYQKLNDSYTIDDLLLYVYEYNNCFELELIHSDKYDKKFALSFAETFVNVATKMLTAKNLSDIPLINSKEHSKIRRFNSNNHKLINKNIVQAYKNSVKEYPNNILVNYKDCSISYRQSLSYVNFISNILKNYGVEKNEFIPVFVERGHWYVISALSVLNSSATYVPIDDKYPDSRVKFILEDVNSKYIICSDATYKRLCGLVNKEEYKLINISEYISDFHHDKKIAKANDKSDLEIKPNDTACVIYTSGTTGHPKGSLLSHKGIINMAESYIDQTNMNHLDIYSLYSSIGFDAALVGIYTSIICGSTIDIVPDECKLDIEKLNNHFTKHGATHTMLTAQVAKMFVDKIKDTSIKYMHAGGEKLGEITQKPPFNLLDAYGPSECTCYVSHINIMDKSDASSLGKLNYNTKAYILDKEKRLLPIGAVGELYISGNQLSNKYLSRDAENQNSFFKNPFDAVDAYSTLYKTGDLMRFLPDMTLAYVGRSDNQVKIRGNRVEVSEVEVCLRDLSFIKDVSVQAIKVGANNELVAYVVLEDNHNIRLEENNILFDVISKHVGDSKPSYMVPSYVLTLDRIPLTQNGKVDKRLLPNVDSSISTDYFVAPSNSCEELVCEQFKNIFDISKVGINDDFVKLGGDSIKAIRLASLLKENNINIEANQIISLKTPKKISEASGYVDIIEYEAVEGPVPLHPVQSFFFDQLNSDDCVQTYVVKAKSKIDVDKLQNAFNELTNIHDVLRASFKNGKAKIRPVNTIVARVEKTTSKGDINKTINQKIKNAVKSISLAKDKLIEINIINDCYIAFTIHHLIVDGVSWSIIIDDLSQLYQGKSVGRPYPYSNFVNDLDAHANNISDYAIEKYVDILSKVDEGELKGKAYNFSKKINFNFDFYNKYEMTEHDFLLLAISRAYKKTYDRDIIYQMESHGRDESIADVNKTVGWFTSIYPLELKLTAEDDTQSVIKDFYSIKKSLQEIDHLGINFLSSCYLRNKFKFKNLPVTFNYLSDEFSHANKLFDTYNSDTENPLSSNTDVFGIDLNISKTNKAFNIVGSCAKGSYLYDKLTEFFNNLGNELKIISKAINEEVIVYTLNEEQSRFYLDEAFNQKGVAYSCTGYLKLKKNLSNAKLKSLIDELIVKHPVLKTRIIESPEFIYGVTDACPPVEIVKAKFSDDLITEIIKPFNLNECCSRFTIINDKNDTYLVYDMHHVISDATSLIVIKSEIEKLINLETINNDLGFIKKNLYEIDKNNSQLKDLAEHYYSNEFDDVDSFAELEANSTSDKGGLLIAPIRNIKEKLENFAELNSITPNNVLTSVFAYTLSRFMNSDKTYFTFTNHGRDIEHLENSIGMFVKILPIVCDTSDQSVKDYVLNCSEKMFTAMKYSTYPFSILSKKYHISQDVCFEYNKNLNSLSESIDGIKYEKDKQNIKHVSDLLCVVNDMSDGYVFSIEHSNKFSKEFAISFAKTFKNVLFEILDKEKLSQINFTNEKDIKLFDKINEDAHLRILYSDIVDVFKHQVKKQPNSICLSDSTTSFTYREVDKITDYIAKKIIDSKKQGPVAFIVKRSFWYLICMIASLKSGITYVPIDSQLPMNRISSLLKDSGANIILTNPEVCNADNKLKSLFNKNDAFTILLNDRLINSALSSKESTFKFNPDVVDSTAALVYTSGTTGQPKGVQVKRDGILNLAAWYKHRFKIGNRDVYGYYSSVSFIVHLNMFYAIYGGAQVDIIPDEVRLNMRLLNDYLIAKKVTHIFLTSRVAEEFFTKQDNNIIKVAQKGGEKVEEFLYKGKTYIFEGYGATETGAASMYCPKDKKRFSSEIGSPVSNLHTYILDNEGRRLPAYAVGELYISGTQVANGYLNDQKMTDSVFVKNHLENGEKYRRMYKTGDFAYYMKDGSVVNIGRRDSIKKINGNRVSLSEIEFCIDQINEIDASTVQIVNTGLSNVLVAYIVIKDKYKAKINDQELAKIVFDHVSKEKPSFMVPSIVKKIDKIPLNINGKIAKAKLPTVDQSMLKTTYMKANDETEKMVCELFAKILNVSKIGIQDDFITLGGDSLKAIQFISGLNGKYSLSASDVLSLRTPKMIAQRLKDTKNEYIDKEYDIKKGHPLTDLQLSMYLDIKVRNKDDVYLNVVKIDIKDDVSVNRIKNGIDELIRIYPEIATRIKMIDNLPWIVPSDEIQVVTLNKPAYRDINRYLKQDFDLNSSLSRFVICKYSSKKVLYCIFNHIITDLFSLEILQNTFNDIIKKDYVAKKIDYGVYKLSDFENDVKTTELFADATKFYDNELSNLRKCGNLVHDDTNDCGGELLYRFNIDSKKLDDFVAKNNTSKGAFFTSAFAYSLSKFTQSDYVQFCITTNGRSRFDFQNSFGLFSRTSPIVLNCQNNDIPTFINDSTETYLNIIKYDFYSFRNLFEKYGFDAEIVFQYIPSFSNTELNNSKKNYSYKKSTIAHGIDDFLMYAMESNNKVNINLKHSNAFSKKFVDIFIKTFSEVVNQLLACNELSDIKYSTNKDIHLINAKSKSKILNIDSDDKQEDRDQKKIKVTSRSKITTESKIKKYVSEALGVKESKIYSDTVLTSLGLNSFVCIKLLSTFDEAGFSIEISDMLTNPSVGKWAEIIDNNKSADNIGITKTDLEYYPLTNSAKYIYKLVNKTENESKNMALFNTPKLFSISGYKAENVKEAILRVVDLHPGLKSKIIIKNNKPCLMPRNDWRPAIRIKKLIKTADEKYFNKLVKPFDILRDDLFRASIFVSGKKVFVFFDIHHIITDGISNEIIMADILTCLKGGKVQPEEFNLFDYSIYQADKLKDNSYAADKNYFKNLVKNYRNSDFDSKNKSTAKNSLVYDMCSSTFKVSDVLQYCNKHNISDSSFFLSNIMWTYFEYCNSNKIMLYSIDSGRKISQSSNICGCLFDIYPVTYTKLKSDNFSSASRKISGQLKKSYAKTFNLDDNKVLMNNAKIFYNYHAEFQSRYHDKNLYFKNLNEYLITNNVAMSFPVVFTIDTDGGSYISCNVLFHKDKYSKNTFDEFMSMLENNINNLLGSSQ